MRRRFGSKSSKKQDINSTLNNLSSLTNIPGTQVSGSPVVGNVQMNNQPQISRGSMSSFPGMPAFQPQGQGGQPDQSWLSSALQGAKNFAVGTNPSAFQMQRFSPWQQYIQYILGNQGIQNADFGNIEQRELSRFNQQTIPGIAERFQAMPGSNQNSSGFQSSLGSAGANLGERLAALRSQYGLQQVQGGLQPQFENIFQPGSEGLLQKLIPGAVKKAAGWFGF